MCNSNMMDYDVLLKIKKLNQHVLTSPHDLASQQEQDPLTLHTVTV
jgi:hypothetical protein